MRRSDVSEVVNACDAGREGELIFRLVYHAAGCDKPFSRLWISSMEKSAIKRGFAELKPGEAYDALYASALCRAKADWIIGINATRLFSVLHGKTLNVGRVQTPTLKMLADRDAAITSFKKETYHIVRLDVGGAEAASARISDAADAEALKTACEASQAISLAALILPLVISIYKRKKIDIAFRCFLLEPDDRNEYLLCESFPASMRPYLRELGQHLRTQQEYGKEQKLKIADYENYIEKWAHEIKKPLSLMTLLLDNRKGEMSPLVHTRMLYVRDYARQSVEQILYFSRLGAVHKDYCFEQLSVLETCREAVEDNFSLLEEAGFSVVYTGDDRNAVSDKKGFMFILGQIISNSVKYAGKNPAPTIQFSVADHADSGEIILSISDNGTGIPVSDLPFVFDKGFTGDTGSYLSRSTGMGLYLVRQMANDLTLKVSIFSNANGGTTVTLMFPKVEQPLRR